MGERIELEALATLYGVERGYHDVTGCWREASVEALLAVLGALGAPVATMADVPEALAARRAAAPTLPPTLVVWEGAPRTLEVPGLEAAEVVLEGGGGRRLAVDGTALTLPGDLPVGRHRVVARAGGATHTASLLAAPTLLFGAGAPRRDLGVFLPVYALRHRGGRRVGDLGALEALCRWAATQGADTVATLPLFATFLDGATFEPSPYAPVSRLFYSELYLDLAALPGLDAVPEAKKALDRLTPCDAREIDYALAYRELRSVVDPLVAGLPEALRSEVDAFASRELDTYATFRARTARYGPFHAWPTPTPDADPREVEVHRYAQWALSRQLGRLTETGVDLYLDLPVGVHPDGYDVWRRPDLFVAGVSAGAPPDPFFQGGQDWGFPPLHPERILDDGLDYWLACLEAAMRSAQVLRIDHLMGLHRLYWVPRGYAPTEGVYVRYPVEPHWAALSIASHRWRCRLVGENLGTVPEEVEVARRAHGMPGIWVGEFSVGTEPGAALQPPAPGDLASLDTHDTVPFAGWWHGDDIETRIELGLLGPEAAEGERAVRARQRASLVEDLRRAGLLAPGEEGPRAVLDAWLAWLAGTPAGMVLVNLEDLALERTPQNVPGTHRERPNWRRRAAFHLEDLEADDAAGRTLALLTQRRKESVR